MQKKPRTFQRPLGERRYKKLFVEAIGYGKVRRDIEMPLAVHWL